MKNTANQADVARMKKLESKGASVAEISKLTLIYPETVAHFLGHDTPDAGAEVPPEIPTAMATPDKVPAALVPSGNIKRVRPSRAKAAIAARDAAAAKKAADMADPKVQTVGGGEHPQTASFEE